jgi:hypothetical protein
MRSRNGLNGCCCRQRGCKTESAPPAYATSEHACRREHRLCTSAHAPSVNDTWSPSPTITSDTSDYDLCRLYRKEFFSASIREVTGDRQIASADSSEVHIKAGLIFILERLIIRRSIAFSASFPLSMIMTCNSS